MIDIQQNWLCIGAIALVVVLILVLIYRNEQKSSMLASPRRQAKLASAIQKLKNPDTFDHICHSSGLTCPNNVQACENLMNECNYHKRISPAQMEDFTKKIAAMDKCIANHGTGFNNHKCAGLIQEATEAMMPMTRFGVNCSRKVGETSPELINKLISAQMIGFDSDIYRTLRPAKNPRAAPRDMPRVGGSARRAE